MINLISMKINKYEVNIDNNKMSTLQNVKIRSGMKIPDGAKRVGNYVLGKILIN